MTCLSLGQHFHELFFSTEHIGRPYKLKYYYLGSFSSTGLLWMYSTEQLNMQYCIICLLKILITIQNKTLNPLWKSSPVAQNWIYSILQNNSYTAKILWAIVEKKHCNTFIALNEYSSYNSLFSKTREAFPREIKLQFALSHTKPKFLARAKSKIRLCVQCTFHSQRAALNSFYRKQQFESIYFRIK